MESSHCDVDGAVRSGQGKCICAWRNCDDIKKQFCANLPADHVWNGLLIRVKKGLNAKEKKNISRNECYV